MLQTALLSSPIAQVCARMSALIDVLYNLDEERDSALDDLLGYLNEFIHIVDSNIPFS